jgi:hypothetical protein
LYIDNLISGLLLVDVAINLHKSSKCKVPSSFKDLVDTATTTSGTRGAAFTAFLALAFFSVIFLKNERTGVIEVGRPLVCGWSG